MICSPTCGGSSRSAGSWWQRASPSSRDGCSNDATQRSALASDNERLYDEQRQIAETLQLGLLPQHFDAPEGVAVAARYWPAGAANLIGGDFYDMFASTTIDGHSRSATCAARASRPRH